MKTQLIKYYVSHNGINNLLVVCVVYGWLQLAQFHGKSAMRRATTWRNKFEKGLTPNN